MADLLSAISIILVILFFVVNAFEKEVSEFLAERNPNAEQKELLNHYNKKLSKLFYRRSIPLVVLLIFIFYILLPQSINILNTSSFSLWFFDELKTLLIFIELGILGLILYIFFITKRLYKKIKGNS